MCYKPWESGLEKAWDPVLTIFFLSGCYTEICDPLRSKRLEDDESKLTINFECVPLDMVKDCKSMIVEINTLTHRLNDSEKS